jgi:hypothetical protein
MAPYGVTSRKGPLRTLRAAEAIRGDSSSLCGVDAVHLPQREGTLALAGRT